MSTVAEIYTQYKIMVSLQRHMLRVAGVAAMICDHLSPDVPVDRENILRACLLHDMANILKFDLTIFPEFLQPEGTEYWQGVKDEFGQKYGKSVHPATIKIVQELGCSQRIVDLIDAVSFNKEKQNFESEDFGRKICAYSDMRVAPLGVVSLTERLEDGKNRYPARSKSDDRFRYAMNALLKKIEVQIFEKCDINPEGITEVEVEKYFPALKEISFTL